MSGKKYTSQYQFGFYDLIMAKSFQIEDSGKYCIGKKRSFESDEYSIYHFSHDGSIELIGFASLRRKYEVRVVVRRFGLDFESIIKFSQIKDIVPKVRIA